MRVKQISLDSYPLLHTSGVFEGMRRDFPKRRPVILTRSAYSGQQRNGSITWSGDTQGNWDVFRKQIPAALNFSMSGIPYLSADIGGFFGGDTHDPKYAELFTRWSSSRFSHPGKEIWNWNGDAQQRLIENVKLRYRLLPYLYSLSWDVMANRGTFMRALAFDFRGDPKALVQTDEYMFGKALLVAPVLEQGATSRNVYLPRKTPWFDFWTGQRLAAGQTVEALAPIDRIPVYARAGSILPLGPVKAYADAPPDGPIEVRVYPGADGTFALYDDSGDGFDYQRGKYGLVHFSWKNRCRTLMIGQREGRYASNPGFRIVCGSSASDGRDVSYAGQAIRVKLLHCQ